VDLEEVVFDVDVEFDLDVVAKRRGHSLVKLDTIEFPCEILH
jgi:hypothetical protein